MVKLYDRTLALLRSLAAKDPLCCPDCDEYENMINEAKSIVTEIDKIS